MAEPQEPQGTTSSAATELSSHEWDAQMDVEYGNGEAQPTGGDRDSGRTLTDLITGGAPTKSQATPPPTGNPLVRWLKNLGRGAASGIREMAGTAAEIAHATTAQDSNVGRAVRSLPLVGPAFGAATAVTETLTGGDADVAKDAVVSEEQLNAVYGAKPQDTMGALLHAGGQFVASTAVMTPLTGFAGAGFLAGGVAFDPFEETVSEIAVKHEEFLNKVPVAGRVIYNVARQLESKEGEDTPLEARFKNAVEGEGMGRVTAFLLRPVFNRMAAAWVEGRASGSIGGVAKAAVTGESPTAQAAAKAAKDAEMAALRAKYEGQLADMNKPAATDVVEVSRNGDGTASVRPVQKLREPTVRNGGRPNSNVQKFNDRVNEEFGFAPGEDPVVLGPNGEPLARLKTTNRGGDVVEIELVENLSGVKGEASKVLERLNALADENNVTLSLQASPLQEGLAPEKLRDVYRKVGFEQTKAGDANMVRRPGDVAPEFRELDEAVGTNYTDEAAAVSDAATANAVAMENGRALQMFTPDEVRLHTATVERLRAGDVGALETNPHFNLQSMGTSDAVDAQIGALTTQYSDLFSVAQGRPSVPNEVLHHAAAQWASEVHLDNFLPALAKADEAGRVALSMKAALYNAATKQAGQEVAEISMLMAAKPGDTALEMLMRQRMETFLRVSEATANFNTELGRGLQALSARNASSASAIRFGSGVKPRPEIMATRPPRVPTFRPLNPESLSPERLAAYGRLFQRSGGDIRIVSHVMEAMHKEWVQAQAAWAAKPLIGGKVTDAAGKVLLKDTIGEIATSKMAHRLVGNFINSLISGFKTMSTIALSGAAVNAYQASAKVLAGAGTLNRGLVEEGTMQMTALFYYSRRSMRGAWGAFKQNRSLIDATPPFNVDDSRIMKGIQVPGRVAGSLDEFTRTAAYHADEFSAAFRQARDEGLSFADAWKRADYDVTLSVDEATGMGLNPAALKRAGIPTLSDHLGNDTFVGKIANTLAEYPLSKLVITFIRPSVNTFRFAWMNSPGLNKWQRDAQAIMLRGGEEATVLHTQTAMAGSMMVYSMSKWMDGSITGAGPTDPQLRALWDRDHKPYSIKIDGEWHSYRRFEPFSTFVGTVADAMEIYHEIPEEDKDELQEKMEGVFAAIASGTARNTTSKSWTESLLNALSALDDKDSPAMKRYWRGVLSGMVPYSAAIRQFNPDPVWREVRSVFDGVRAAIPGWSESLPARYHWDGEKRAKQGSMWNRNLATFPTHTPGESLGKDMGTLEDELVDSYIRLAPPNPRPYKGIDMFDKRWANKDGKVPYDVYMEKLAGTGVRRMVEDIVRSQSFRQAPKGSQAYPESLRGQLVTQVVGGAQTTALNQMLAEFTGEGNFTEAFNRARYVIPVIGKYEGAEAANAEKDLYGIPTEVRR
jgi:hypothetical protein